MGLYLHQSDLRIIINPIIFVLKIYTLMKRWFRVPCNTK